MKNFLRIIPFLILAIGFSSCNSSSSEAKKEVKESLELSDNIQIYYFHNTKRCATCNAVEDEAKIAIEMFYEDKLKAGELEFASLNLEEEDGKEMASALGIAGQTLLLVKGETKVNLTSQAFMNARKNPSEFHNILKTELDKLQ